MSLGDSFRSTMRQLQAGDEEAAARVFHRFARRLIAFARTQLNGRLRAKLDPEDVVQSVLRSFFLRQRSRPFELADWDNLWSLLTVITVRKCGRRLAQYQSASRDLDLELTEPRASQALLHQASTREPTPEEAATLTDLVAQLLHGHDEREQNVVVLHLQGCTVEEISAQIQRSARTVRRVLHRARRRLQRLLTEEPADAAVPASKAIDS